MKKTYLLVVVLFFTITSNSQKKVINTEPVSQDITEEVQVLKRKVAIARFSNETQYAKGMFYDKNNDPMGKQTVDILSTKLAASNKFILLERQDLDKILAEINLTNSTDYQKVGADYLIIGSITEEV